MPDIYAPQTRYNYWLKINHPLVYPEFQQYCREIGEPEHYPLSDAQRRTFEVRYLMRHGIDHTTPEWVRFQFAELTGKQT